MTIKLPYLNFLGDHLSKHHAKTALGVHDWLPLSRRSNANAVCIAIAINPSKSNPEGGANFEARHGLPAPDPKCIAVALVSSC